MWKSTFLKYWRRLQLCAGKGTNVIFRLAHYKWYGWALWVLDPWFSDCRGSMDGFSFSAHLLETHLCWVNKDDNKHEGMDCGSYLKCSFYCPMGKQ